MASNTLLTARSAATPGALVCCVAAAISDVSLKLRPKVATIQGNNTSVALLDRRHNVIATQPYAIAKYLGAVGANTEPLKLSECELLDFVETNIFLKASTTLRCLTSEEGKSDDTGLENALAFLDSAISRLTDCKNQLVTGIVFATLYPLFTSSSPYSNIGSSKFANLSGWFKNVEDNAKWLTSSLNPIKVKSFDSLNLQVYSSEKDVFVEKKKTKKKDKTVGGKFAFQRDAAWSPLVAPGHSAYSWGRPRPHRPAALPINKPHSSSNQNANTERKYHKRVEEKRPVPLPVHGERNVLITSALPYVNNVPHLGNLIGCVLSADVYARFCRLRGYNTLYICGTDEYGTATETKALAENCTPKQLCDKFNKIHTSVYEWFNISFDHFGRTTTPQQTEIAQSIFNQCDANNLIKQDEVEQLYCTKCSRYLADRYVEGTCPDEKCAYPDARGDQCDKCQQMLNATDLINPRCKVCSNAPVKRTSQHLFLDLPALADELEEWVDKSSLEGKWSENSTRVTKARLRDGLIPRCITRDLKWGTPCPKDGYTDKVFYVWFDAPIGYISITANALPNDWEKWWKNPENVELVQFMGKDNIPFHCVIFPSSLLATKDNWTMLHHISTTEYLNYEGGKFSKSRGTGVFGDGVQKTGLSTEVWRYYLLVNRPETQDTQFKWTDFAEKNNKELLNNLGNFVHRALTFATKYFDGVVPACADLTAMEIDLFERVNSHVKAYIEALEAVQIKEALKIFMGKLSKDCNEYFQAAAIWTHVKNDKKRAETIMAVALNLTRLLAICADPFMPTFTDKVSQQMNLKFTEHDKYLDHKTEFKFSCNLIPVGHKCGAPSVIFRQITDEETSELRKRFGGDELGGDPFPARLIAGKVTEVSDNNGVTQCSVDVGSKKAKVVLCQGLKDPIIIGQHVVLCANTGKLEKVCGVQPTAALLCGGNNGNRVPLQIEIDTKANDPFKLGSLVKPQGSPFIESSFDLASLNLSVNGDGNVVFGSAPFQVASGKVSCGQRNSPLSFA